MGLSFFRSQQKGKTLGNVLFSVLFFFFSLIGLFVPSELLHAATSNANGGHPEKGFCCDMQIPTLLKGTFQDRGKAAARASLEGWGKLPSVGGLQPDGISASHKGLWWRKRFFIPARTAEKSVFVPVNEQLCLLESGSHSTRESLDALRPGRKGHKKTWLVLPLRGAAPCM